MLCSLVVYPLFKLHYIPEGLNLSMDHSETLNYHTVCLFGLRQGFLPSFVPLDSFKSLEKPIDPFSEK